MMKTTFAALSFAALVLAATFVSAQQPMRTVHDAQDRLTFQIPANWALASRDRELSTFHQEARTAPKGARLRFVAAIPENPYPASTFSGAHFYISAVPVRGAAACAAQTAPLPTDPNERYAAEPLRKPDNDARVGDRPAHHGRDQHGQICTQFRDDVYTLRHDGTCLRFDLAMNNFCGGEVSGVKDMTKEEIFGIRQRLEAILKTVTFDR